MKYLKNNGAELDIKLFQNPTSEYRDAPFWSWNSIIQKKDVVSKSRIFKEMGFGGYHIHSRTGLNSEYLGKEFMDGVKACVEESKKDDTIVYLYDEDRYPSGFAGGKISRIPEYRIRRLILTEVKSDKEPQYGAEGRLIAGDKLLARYKLNVLYGELFSYKRIKDDEDVKGKIYYAYLSILPNKDWYAGYTYVDTMYKKCMDEFANLTYGAYEKAVGNEFGKTIPSMFTDEPQLYISKRRRERKVHAIGAIPWTDDLEDSFQAVYNESLLDKLPELFYNLSGKEVSPIRVRYNDHITERFVCAFADNLGERCKEMGIDLTGHLMEEPTLKSQTDAVGEAMRHYRGFGLPGIDILRGGHEFTTAKQAQSASRQFGRGGVLSELYGVSKWNVDFRKFKEEGDWQAALGITLRVPHLSYLSMKGDAKRDYPPSIYYQTSWYKRFKVVEDHFARVNTALTRGKPICNIGVIHPIESFWALYGKRGSYSLFNKKASSIDKRFIRITDWLIRSAIDFDFIDESLLPSLTAKGGYPLKVGEMEYTTIIIPSCITLRSTTLDRLEQFVSEGGTLIFAGNVAGYENAIPSVRAKKLSLKSSVIPFKKEAIVNSLKNARSVEINDKKGELFYGAIYQLRKDGNSAWLFIARPTTNGRVWTKRYKDELSKKELNIKVKGEYQAVSLWNTADGSVKKLNSFVKDGYTEIKRTLYNNDSLLLRFDYEDEGIGEKETEKCIYGGAKVALEDGVPYSLSEPNVYILDKAYYSINGGKYSRTPELVSFIAKKAKKKLGLQSATRIQPWFRKKAEARDKLSLKFFVDSKIDVKDAKIALEDAEIAIIKVNGKEVDTSIDGFFTDTGINTRSIPEIRKGRNEIEITMPFSGDTTGESCFLLGNFGVKIILGKPIIVSLPTKLRFADITKQGFPFYGGIITYHSSFKGLGQKVRLEIPLFRSALVDIETDKEKKYIAYAPFEAELDSVVGKNRIDLSVYASRDNSFGLIHFIKKGHLKNRPSTYDLPRILYMSKYVLTKTGILKKPRIEYQKTE